MKQRFPDYLGTYYRTGRVPKDANSAYFRKGCLTGHTWITQEIYKRGGSNHYMYVGCDQMWRIGKFKDWNYVDPWIAPIVNRESKGYKKPKKDGWVWTKQLRDYHDWTAKMTPCG